MSNEERSRILAMVSSGRLSPEEADLLFSEMERKGAAETVCPYCAETIPGALPQCPVCKTKLGGPVATGLSSLSKGLAIYMIVITAIVILGSLPIPGMQTPLALVGLVAGILMLKGMKWGWILGAGWSGLQILLLYVGNMAINQQFLRFDFPFLTNGAGLGINLVGIVLLVLFIKAAPEWRNRS